MGKLYKSLLTLISIMIVSCFALGIVYVFYDKNVSETTIVLVDGNLSINYLNGNVINEKDNSNYNLKLSVTNNSSEYVSYSINLADVKSNANDVKLTVENTTLNSIIGEFEFPDEDQTLVADIEIASGETHNYNIFVNQGNEEVFEAILKIREEKPTITTFSQTILTDNVVSNTTLTTIGSEIATNDEGLIADIDDAGSTYYFRGNINNNYVSFANNTWRIVRINGDGTVKLVLDNIIDTVQAFYINTNEDYYKYDNSNIKEYLTNWYDYNLKEYDEYVSIDKYCNDFTRTNDEEFIYQSYIRNITNKIPTFNCLGKNVGAKIGMLTADEVIYAGGLSETENTSYYLYNSNIAADWWTMTPATGTSTSMNPFVVKPNGALNNQIAGNLNRGVRPVISLIKDIEVEGSGTKNDPYVIKTK